MRASSSGAAARSSDSTPSYTPAAVAVAAASGAGGASLEARSSSNCRGQRTPAGYECRYELVRIRRGPGVRLDR